MSKEERFTRLANKWVEINPALSHTPEYFIEKERKTKLFLSDLTALISEHYYPKEFVEWCIIWVFEIDGKYHLRIEGKATFESMDKLYSYWDKLPAYMKKPKKENER